MKQLRNKGCLPGIIFGIGLDNTMIHISSKDFHQWAKGGGAGIVQTDSTAIEVQALPVNLPSSITINISDFDIGAVLRGGEVNLPEGVSLVSSPNETLVSTLAPQIVEEESEELATD